MRSKDRRAELGEDELDPAPAAAAESETRAQSAERITTQFRGILADEGIHPSVAYLSIAMHCLGAARSYLLNALDAPGALRSAETMVRVLIQDLVPNEKHPHEPVFDLREIISAETAEARTEEALAIDRSVRATSPDPADG